MARLQIKRQIHQMDLTSRSPTSPTKPLRITLPPSTVIFLLDSLTGELLKHHRSKTRKLDHAPWWWFGCRRWLFCWAWTFRRRSIFLSRIFTFIWHVQLFCRSLLFSLGILVWGSFPWFLWSGFLWRISWSSSFPSKICLNNKKKHSGVIFVIWLKIQN